jgi:uncharacterized protein (DUF983 family)
MVILVNCSCYGYDCDHYSCYDCNQYIVISVVGIVTTFQQFGYYRFHLVRSSIRRIIIIIIIIINYGLVVASNSIIYIIIL